MSALRRPKRARVAVAAFGSAAIAAIVAIGPIGGPAGTPSAGAATADGKSKQKRKERLERQRRANANQKRPNVVVIETDDQNQSEMTSLPLVLDKLGRYGTTFTNSYVSFPLCCPSRATFLTGQYAHNHGVVTTDLPNGYNGLRHTNTLAVWLRKSGYRTGMVGKYLNGYGLNDNIIEPVSDAKEIPPGWNEWYALTAGTDQRRYGYKLNENGRVRQYGSGPANYVTDVLSGKAIDFIRRRARYPRPFFLWFTPTAPHGQAGLPFGSSRDPEPALRHLGRFEGSVAPRTPNFNEDNVSDKPDLVKNQPKLGTADIEDIDRRWRGRQESLLSVDDAVRRIVARLKKANDLRKTYIIFTSDNGLQLGSHRLVFKSYLYEESTRVPLIIRGPGFPGGAVRDQLVSNIDLAPTIAAIARAKPRLAMDGISLLPLAKNASAAAGRDLLFEAYDFRYNGLRSGRWQYNLYANGDEELYDLVADPYQLVSRHDDPGDAGIKAQLQARLAQLLSCAGASCR